MIKKHNFVIILILVANIIFSRSAFADSATTSTTTVTSLPTVTPTPTPSQLIAPLIPPIISEMKAAKVQLSAVTLNHAINPVYKTVKNKKTGKTTQVVTKYVLGDKDIALAILDPSNNNIIVTMGRLNGQSMAFPDPNVSIQLVKFNGVNSRFAVNKPANGVVIALKYLISKTDSGTKGVIEKGLSPVIYVPYSPQINSPDVIAYGQNYLDGVIKEVVREMTNQPSTAIPGKTITEAIPPAMIKSLVYAEHTETASLLSGDAKGALDQLNILFATNEGDAYKYSVSNDGYASRGIAQFVPSTYASLVQRHPSAGLNPNFVAGMEDHVNSVKAMYYLLDDYAGDVRIKATQGFVASRVFDYGAASYNAGTSRVIKAVNQFGDNWNQDRAEQISSLQEEVNSLTAQVKSLKSKVKSTKDKKAKAVLQSQLNTAAAQLADTSTQLKQLDEASLKNVTINYLSKIYKVIPYFNDQTI